jgi:hypothetical protein
MNSIGGGVYAMDWLKEGIRVWFFPHSAIPADIRNGNPTTAGWGKVHLVHSPAHPSRWPICLARIATFPNISSIIRSSLTSRIRSLCLADRRFCGDWAGALYPNSGCPGKCTDKVAWDPQSFKSSYFGVKSLRVYKSS